MKTTIGTKLKELREQHGLTQDGLAEYLNISRQAISQWENGKVYPDIDNIVLLCELYKITSDELLDIKILKENQEDLREALPKQNKTSKSKKQKGEWVFLIFILLVASRLTLAGIALAIIIALWLTITRKRYRLIYMFCVLCVLVNLLNFCIRWCVRV